MRVISGSAKGRTLKPAGAATRPITDRVKESLFNILAARVVDANVLDLFAGAGSVGIEALSRGARAATFVELDRDALNAIRANLQATRLADRARLVRRDVFKFVRHGGGVIASAAKQSPRRELEIASSQKPLLAMTQSAGEGTYDLIYVAPPQYKGLWAETLRELDDSGLLAPRGIVVAQIHPKEYTELALTNLELFDQRKYGSTLLCFYRNKSITCSSLV
ncbi:MAG: RsmD family RNA methyltransferase [Chloroflexota bacterium]